MFARMHLFDEFAYFALNKYSVLCIITIIYYYYRLDLRILWYFHGSMWLECHNAILDCLLWQACVEFAFIKFLLGTIYKTFANSALFLHALEVVCVCVCYMSWC